MKLEIKNLNFSYPSNKEVLKGVNLSIKEGEHHFIIGKIGSGKSTLIQTLNGLKTGTFDKFEVCKIKMNKDNLKEIREKVAMVIQFPENQIFESTVEKEIAFGLKKRNIDFKDKVKEIMERFKLDYSSVRDVSPFSLSGGQMRKVAIASILVLDPEIIILDEPTCGLDPVTSKELMEILDEYKAAGKTIIHITHDMDLVCEYADRVSFLKKGTISLSDIPKKVFGHKDELLSGGIKAPHAYLYSELLKSDSLKKKSILEFVKEVY